MKIKLILFLIIITNLTFAQKSFKTNNSSLKIYVNSKLVEDDWKINPSINPDIFEAEVKGKTATIEYKDSLNSISFTVKLGQKINFVVFDKNNQEANQQIIGVEPNVKFTKKYIKEHQGKTIVDIPEVSELVNIIMVLHKDAEKEENMFDTKTEYYRKVKSYFEPFKNHPIVDTIQKYIKDIEYKEGYNAYVFPITSYWYYYAMKMNACAYKFDKYGNIVNTGVIKEIAKGYNPFDPMKDLKLIQDFAHKTNFRKFYENNKPYYNELLKTYEKLNPVQKMQSWLDEKYKFSYGSYKVYFSPLISGAHSTKRYEDNGFKQTFMFIARAEFDNKYEPIMNELIESKVVFTEIDHNYVNPISYKFSDRINESFSNREKWAKGEQTEAYETPFDIFNEYMTYGVYSLYVLDNYTTENVEEILLYMEGMMEENRGFHNFKDFNRELIRQYKMDRVQSMEILCEKMLDWSLKKNIE